MFFMQLPENGFYYHYRHGEEKSFNDYAYEIVGTGKHSEDESIFVTYRPLYKNNLSPQNYYVRPIELFFDEVVWKDKTLPHFCKITDPEIITKLLEIKNQLYGSKASTTSESDF